MQPGAWLALLVTAGIFAVMQRRGGISSDVLFLAGLVCLVLAEVLFPNTFRTLTPTEALVGFASPVVITIAGLFVVAAGLRTTGALDWVGMRLLGRASTPQGAIARLAAPIVAISAFMNNTPIVAMLVPVASDWCRRRGISPSRLLMPISYLAIIGGTCTLIGTSTNLVVNGMLAREQQRITEAQPQAEAVIAQLRPMHLFEIGYVGLPTAALCALYIITIGSRRLPNRTDLVEQLGEHRREYLVEMMVQPECRLIGQTVEEAGLRHLPGLFLIEINREDEVITPVAPEDHIHAGDRLVFTGVVSTIADLEKIPGLVPAADMNYEVHPQKRTARKLTEAVLSESCPSIGKTVRAARFRQLYNAAVVAVHRNGRRLPSKIGDIRLQAGDTLLLQTRSDFAEAFRNNPDFYLVADVDGSTGVRSDRAWIAFLLLALLIGIFTVATLVSGIAVDRGALMAIGSICVAGLMVGTRCLPASQARLSLDLQVLLTIGAALGLGQALTNSGAVNKVAEEIVLLLGTNEYLLLAAVILMTFVFTELITNTAVAALMVPLAVALATQQGVAMSPRPLVIAVTLAASASFLTPVGYQTNLMVMGPGGYHARDYLKAGLPITIIVFVTAMVLIPLFWPFH